MNSTDIPSVLSKLGITQGLDDQGQLVWSLKLSDPQRPGKHRLAFFNDNKLVWALADDNHDGVATGNGNIQNSARSIRFTNEKDTRSFDARLASDSWYEALPQNEHTAFFTAKDWSETLLGPLNSWPHALRLHTHTLFSDRRPGAIYWGDHRIAIYNEDVPPLIGPLHPGLMGQSFEIAMPGLWTLFRPMFDSVRNDGKGIVRTAMEVPTERYGYLEETYWDGGLISLKDDTGAYGGTQFVWTEVTRLILRDRRTDLINELAQSAGLNTVQAWQHLHATLVRFPRDVSMALFYATKADAENELYLENTIGVHMNESISPSAINLQADNSSVVGALFRRTQDSSASYLTFDVESDNINPSLFETVNWAGYGEPSRNMAVLCVRSRNLVQGYILLGLNPRLALDDDHKQFLSEMTRQINERFTAAAISDLSRQREQDLQQALTDSERLMSKLVHMAPVGIYELSVSGVLTWANRHFFDIFGVAQDKRDPSTFNWHDHILPEDQQKANVAMGRSIMEKAEISDTLRLNRRWRPPGFSEEEDSEEPYWVLYSASPDVLADGSVRALMGCITDISHLKWAELLQARNAETAQRERRRQEEFIDVISHEMRNPLSAITQCADSILSSMHEATPDADRQTLLSIVKHNVEAAESVSFCASHQKRIIDDVLALSKLDSGLLTISPIPFRLDMTVDQTLQMFKGEFAASNIDVRIISDKTTIPLHAVIYGDSARMTQIIVNLLTNAIKFTRTEETRTIMIRYGLSASPPDRALFGDTFEWQATSKDRTSPVAEPKQKDTVSVYPYFAVSDSGKGIAGDSTERVFCKFEQADQKTYVNYGGSGLGLYISRELAEIQGGHIGIESAAAIGSTFAFYTKAERSKKHTIQDNTAVAQSEENGFLKKRRLSTGLRILLVEDNLLNQRVLAKLLIKAGCLVSVANHGGEAIDFMLQLLGRPAEYASSGLKDAPEQFDCILMDWEMPICNGLDSTKRIRQIEAAEGVPENVIIGITANAREDQIATALQAGMDSVLSKPFRIEDVMNRVQDVLKSKSMIKPSKRQSDTTVAQILSDATVSWNSDAA